MKHFYTIIILLCLSLPTQAQYYLVGPTMNHLSYGILLGKRFDISDRWQTELSLRYLVNTFSINKNKENFLYYKNGYAFNFWQHFGFNAKLDYKLFTLGRLKTYVSANFVLTAHGIRNRYNNVPTFDSTAIYPTSGVERIGPGPALESTIGLQIQYEISDRSDITMGAGMGILRHDFPRIGFDETYNKITFYNSGAFLKRGGWEFIGFTVPTIYMTYAYKIGRN